MAGKKVSEAPTPIKPVRGGVRIHTKKRNYELDSEYWKAKEIWEDHEIPYLFLGYNPKPCEYDKSCRTDDSLSLNKQEEKLYNQYLKLIREAVYLGTNLTTYKRNNQGGYSLRAVEIKQWRKKKKRFIKPAQIYIKMEKKIQDLQGIITNEQVNGQDVDQSNTHSETTQSNNGSTTRENQKSKTKERNKMIQNEMESLAEIEKDKKGAFTLYKIAKKLQESGKIKNVSIDLIVRVTKKTW